MIEQKNVEDSKVDQLHNVNMLDVMSTPPPSSFLSDTNPPQLQRQSSRSGSEKARAEARLFTRENFSRERVTINAEVGPVTRWKGFRARKCSGRFARVGQGLITRLLRHK